MLEKIKEVPFIDESAAVKVVSDRGKVRLERNDRVVWASEKTSLEAEGINCYVEAQKFLALLPEIKALSQGTCLEVELKNGAKYELPFLTVEWESQVMPTEYSDNINFSISNLILCTLKNLIKPELQCIWIDEHGAVSCDFISACVSEDVKATRGFLLPPEIQELVNGRTCKVEVTDDKIFILAQDFEIITSRPTVTDDEWYSSLREMVEGAEGFKPASKLLDGLKRLAMFGEYVSFNGTVAMSGTNFEPFDFEDLQGNRYEIERLSRVLAAASSMTVSGGNLVLKEGGSLFLISPMEDA